MNRRFPQKIVFLPTIFVLVKQNQEECLYEDLKIRKSIYEYKLVYPFTLVTTRFTNQTWEDNCRYRKDTLRNTTECIYATSKPMSQSIATDSYVMVLKMNNDTNRVMGIGCIKNRPLYLRHFIYQKEAWNTFSYEGKLRKDRMGAVHIFPG